MYGWVRSGKAGKARSGAVLSGMVRQGRRGESRFCTVSQGMASRGAVQVRHGRQGEFGQGLALRGEVWFIKKILL